MKLNRRAATEGIVLLENKDNTLPLQKGEKVAVYGRAQIDYYRSGTGSGGAVNIEYATNILDGLRANQINIHEGLVRVYEEWLVQHPFDDGGGGWAAEPWFQQEMPLTTELVEEIKKYSDKALYVIGRTAGEDKDNQKAAGSYYLTKQEQTNLEILLSIYENVVIILNTSNIIDMSWTLNIANKEHIKAILSIWQGGMEGGLAAGDVLSGAVTPSGKLPDTIAYAIEDYPSDQNFGSSDRNIYQEDIYVGYRYFETFCPDKVQYEFGYGLSYTSFAWKFIEACIQEESCQIKIEVKNTGHKYSGKEVIQIYFEAPQGHLGKPAKQLIGFKKTQELKPQETCTIEFSIQIKDMASYDDSGITGYKSCYVLEAGAYTFYVGNSIKNVDKIVGFDYYVDNIQVLEQLSEVLAPNENFQILKPTKKRADGSFSQALINVSIQTVDIEKRIQDNLPMPLEFTGDREITLQDVKSGKKRMEDFISQLSITEMAMLVRGEGMSHPKVTKGTASAFGGVSDRLLQYGIPLACCADGPSGLRMEAPSVQLPIGTLLAASWNPELVRELYMWEGKLMCSHEVDTLLGPGVNIHRHPLNGRNFEYYSEDPYLTGVMAIAVTGGLKDGGASGTIKHFACNGQEAYRHTIDAVCSERAIREIYLKGFEMAVKAGTVTAIMTSYNPINGHWAASNYDLNTTVLRKEWGFTGIVMTDWWAKMNDVVMRGPESDQDTRNMIRAGNDLYMVVNNNGAEINSNNDNTLKAIESGSLTIGELQQCAANICRFILNAPVMRRELKLNEVIEYFPAKENVKVTALTQLLSNDSRIQIDGCNRLDLAAEQPGIYSIIVSIRSSLSNLYQSTCKVSLNEKVMTVIQTNGTEGKWITQKLQKIQLDQGCYAMEIEHLQAGLEIEYIQFKRTN